MDFFEPGKEIAAECTDGADLSGTLIVSAETLEGEDA